MNARRVRVRVADPSTIGRLRFPCVRSFIVLREAERYASRANVLGLGATIELPTTIDRAKKGEPRR